MGLVVVHGVAQPGREGAASLAGNEQRSVGPLFVARQDDGEHHQGASGPVGQQRLLPVAARVARVEELGQGYHGAFFWREVRGKVVRDKKGWTRHEGPYGDTGVQG